MTTSGKTDRGATNVIQPAALRAAVAAGRRAYQETKMQGAIVQRVYAARPRVRLWIDRFVNEHAAHTQNVSTLGFRRLSSCFPPRVLQHTNVVTLPHVPFPPVHRFGIQELAFMQELSIAAITLKDTAFAQRDRISESLHFHEMVHVVQWARLGVDPFLLAYGIGLLQFGYEHNPFEQMAYSLQASFEDDMLPEDLVAVIETRTDAIWRRVAPLLEAGNGP